MSHIRMRTLRRGAGVGALALVAGAAAGCNDFLSCTECITDPNRATTATNSQLFVGVQSGLWGLLGSDMARVTGLLAQHFRGGLQQYVDIYNYGINEQTTNTFHSGLYTGGGLQDIRRLQQGATAANDKFFLGVAQVQEALLMGTGASLFGDLVYSEALKGTPNPPLDEQMAIYTALQQLLSTALTNLASNTAADVGPRAADLAYFRSTDPDPVAAQRDRWTRLAHTLKARLFLHMAEVQGPSAYQSALDEARQGIQDPSGNFIANYSGALNEENLWYQFHVVQRFGYLEPDPFLVGLLRSRNDPRLDTYFQANGTELNEDRFAADFDQPFVTAAENKLIWAEAAARVGGAANEAEAREQLQLARGFAGITTPVPATLTGRALLNEILIEKYIAMFQNIEAWNDYKRTCTPNLSPVDPTRKIPARLFYDQGERNTNNNIPIGSAQPTRNDNDPPNQTSDGTGEVCLGQ